MAQHHIIIESEEWQKRKALRIDTKESQCNTILHFFKKGNGLTTLTAMKWLKIVRLGARLPELKADGNKIYYVWQGRGSSKYKLFFMSCSHLYKKYKTELKPY